MKKNSSLVHSEFASEISIWLQYYPDKLLTVQQYLFLLNQEVYINRRGFDEAGILNGRWGKAYQSMKDHGLICLFDLKSEYFTERFRVLEQSQTFNDPDHQFQNDLASLIYCDINEIPVAFDYDDFFNPAGDREGYNFFTNFARSFTEYGFFIEKHDGATLVDVTGRTSFMLSFNICVDVPKIKSGNSKKVIDSKKLELESTYEIFDPEFRPSFDQFICVNLPFTAYVDVSPADLINHLKDYQPIRDRYQQLQKEITSPEKLVEYKNNLKDQPTSPTGSPPEWNVQDVRLGHLKYRTHDIPHEHSFRNQRIISNKRLRNNSNWLFSVLHLQTTLDSVINGLTF